MEFSAKQAEAIDVSCNVDNRVAAITGAAGTGKTTILKKVYEDLVANGYNVMLTSPTGKAAKRIFEATGIEARTIHRALKYSHPGDPDPKTGKPAGFSYPTYCRANPIRDDNDELIDVLLADEYAMVNSEVHRSVFDALPNGACIRTFGDNNQLQPIEEDKRLQGQPSPFLQLLNNDKFPSVTLDVVHRQGQDSGILTNLQQILRARMPTRNDQWAQKITDQPVKELADYIFEMQDDGVDFSQLQHQIIVPQKTSWVGTYKLNAMVQGLFHNKTDPSILIPRHQWDEGINGEKGGNIRMFVGDKVIFMQNNYNLGVFNGETGIIIEIEQETGEVVVDFGDREQAFPPILMVMNRHGREVAIDPRKDLQLAYAITTHKSQGSEYESVVYILNKSNSYMINRRNFYTACSRAKERVMLFADQRGLAQAVQKRE